MIKSLHPILFILFSLLLQVGQAQLKTDKAKVKWGPEIKASKSSSLSDIFAVDNEYFYALRTDKKEMRIEKYDFNCNQVKSEVLALDEDKKKEREFQLLKHFGGDQIYLFSSFYNKKDEKNYLFMQTVNQKTMTPNNDIKKISEIDLSDSNKKRFSDFSFRTADDSTHFMVYYDKPNQKEGFQKLGMQVYTNTMDLLWEGDIETPYEDELFQVQQRKVDHEGKVYVLGKLYTDKVKDRVKGEPNYSFHLLCYSEGGAQVFDQEIKLDNNFIQDLTFRIADNGDVVCAGFYSEEGKSAIDGVFFLSMDAKSKEIRKISLKEFELDFLTQTLTDKDAKKAAKKAEKGKDVQLLSYDLDQLILRDDGGAVLIGEQYFMREVTTTVSSPNGGVSTRTTYHYHYNNIIVININPNGEIEWATQIPKRQHSINDGGYYSSYASAIMDDHIYFVFNDNVENLYIKEGEKINNYSVGKKSMVVLVHLDKYGEWSKEGIFSRSEADIVTVPKTCEQINSHEMIIFGDWKKSQKFARVSFE